MSDDKAKGHCQLCGWKGVLTKNGRMRTHKGDPDKGVLDNGNCPKGSDLPREATETVPKTESGGPNPHRAPLAPDAPLTTGCAVCANGGHHCFDCEKKVPHGSPEVCRDCQVTAGVHTYDDGNGGLWEHPGLSDDCTVPECASGHNCSTCVEGGCIPCDGGPCCVALSDGSHNAAVNAQKTYDPDCDVCETGTHTCPGCGDYVTHQIGTERRTCDDCEVFYADNPSLDDDPRPTAADVRAAETFLLTAPADVPDGVEESADNILAAAMTYGVRPDPEPEPHCCGTCAADADAAGFLGTDGSDQDDAADFFDSDEPEQAPSKGRWISARYDGSCDCCGAYFEQGDEIRGTEDGWQGRDCCGQMEDDGKVELAPVARPKRIAPKPPLRAGRYRLPHPLTGKPTAFSRVTTFVKKASDSFSLNQWQMRSMLIGLTRQPDILDQVDGLDVKRDRDRLNKLAEMAKDAAGAKDKASTGTKLHKWTEEVDSGRLTLEQVPEEFRTEVRRYREVLEASGYRVVPHLIERTTAVAELGVVGTFDQVWQAPDGRYVIVDKKTGELTYAQMEISAQLAVYAHGVNEHGVAEWDEALGDADDPAAWVWRPPTDENGDRIEIDLTTAVVVHMPQDGRGITLYEVDLVTGWAHAQLCAQVWASHKVKSTMAPIDVAAVQRESAAPAPTAGADLLARVVPQQRVATDFQLPDPPAPAPAAPSLSWADRFAAVTNRNEADAVLKAARDAGMPKERQDELIAVARLALRQNAA